MHRILPLAILLACAAQAAALEIGQLKGTWKPDGEAVWAALVQTPEFAGQPKEQQDMAKAMMLPMFEQMRLTITDTEVVMRDPSGKEDRMPNTGFASTGANTATMTDEKGKQGRVELKDDGSLELFAPEEEAANSPIKSLSFRRVAE